MHDSLNVLVLGVGGNVSQGILKALAIASLRCRVVGACITPLATGLYTVDRAYVSPRADSPAFVQWVVATCRAEAIHAVLSGVEPVLAVLSRHTEEIRQETGAVCIVSDPSRLMIGDDKLETCRWLEENGFSFPRYAIPDDENAVSELVADCGYPLVAKPRAAKGAHGVIKVCNSAELASVLCRQDYILQEFLAEPEYTVGCFCDADGQVRGTIVMQRELVAGTTYRAEAGEFPKVRAEATRIISALQPLGPCNVQLRMIRGRSVCFELNVRFSGTTPLRARFGFNEVEAALRHYVLGEPAADLPVVTHGFALRYWNEVYVDPRALVTLSQTGCLHNPQQFDSTVEDYGIRR